MPTVVLNLFAGQRAEQTEGRTDKEATICFTLRGAYQIAYQCQVVG